MSEAERKDAFYFTVTDLRQYQYCPRIIYFTYVQPVPRRVTRLMKFGEERHFENENLEPRRVIKKYGLDQGRRVFREHLASEKLGLTGKLDLSIHAGAAVYPVEFKFSSEPVPRANYLGQLAGYALLLEEKYQIQVERGFFYLIPFKKIVPVRITEEERRRALVCLERMRDLVARESFPEAVRERGKCVDCEWLNFCGDILIP
ncbi:MAG: CRISPR-associated protein Cas4 [Firmicutes bacterium]|nr:CRISPR-associated protein Cas4 [Bacillota bacterium]